MFVFQLPCVILKKTPEVVSLKRYAMQQLIDWKMKPNRKPLILKGARQVNGFYGAEGQRCRTDRSKGREQSSG